MLAVSSPQPPAEEEEPPMPPMEPQPPMDDGQEMPPMDDGQQMPPDGNDTDEGPYDTNFDAGVDADEETDPKRYIQQLTGKLSQSLRNYNGSLPKPDEDLCKYVANMINKQASQGLSPKDTDEILKKLTDDGDRQDESRYRDGRSIDEIYNDLMGDDSDGGNSYEPPMRGLGYRKSPFTSPDFE